MINELGYKYLLIDSEIISQVVEEELVQELQTFSKFGRIFILGPNKPKTKIPFNFSFINFSPKTEKSSRDVISKMRESKSSLELSKVLKLSKTQIRSKVLYIKKARESVLTDIAKLYSLNFETCRKKRDCDLRVTAYGMENCPHQCVYCFANYSWSQPTTVLFDFDKKLKEDLNKPRFKKITQQGFPIHVGSIMDFGSELSLFFKQIHKVLKVLKGKNIFIGTKSPLVARDDVVEVIKEHGRAEIVFTYTGLGKGLEPNLPYDSRNFPSRAIRKITSNKIRVVLLYKPIISGLNDREEKVRDVFKKAKEAGITEISTGFLKVNYRFQDSTKVNSPQYYKYFKKVLTDRVEKDFLPPFQYRVQMAKKLRKICDELGLRISFCQPYIGDLKSKLANSFCPCRKERWQ